MPKISDNKLTIYDLDKPSIDGQVNVFKPLIGADYLQILKPIKSMAEMANINLAGTIKPVTIPNFSLSDTLEKINFFPELPSLPGTILPNISPISLERYNPPVTIKKSKEDIEKEEQEVYLNKLHIRALEIQLNIVKSIQLPQYDINTGVITFMGKEIIIPLNTNLEMVCRVVLKNFDNMRRNWSWDRIVETAKERPEDYSSTKIYTAVRTINEKVAIETTVKDFLLTKPTTTVRLNPKFLAK